MSLSRVKLIVLCLLGLTCTPSIVHAESCYVRELRTLIRQREAGYLSPAERSQIKSIFENPRLSSLEKAEKAFEIRLEARLKDVPENVAQKVRAAYREVKVKASHQLIGNYRHENGGSVSVEVPKRYLGSIIQRMQETHELEHMLIEHLLKERGVSRGFVQSIKNTATTIFLHEEGAMRAEWENLNSIPANVREELAEEVQKDPDLSAFDRDWIVRFLRNSSLDVDLYLESERNAGRYSLKNIIDGPVVGEMKIKRMLLGIPAGIFTIATFQGLTDVCTDKLDQHGNYPRSKFFMRVCLPNPFVRSEIEDRGGSITPKR